MTAGLSDFERTKRQGKDVALCEVEGQIAEAREPHRERHQRTQRQRQQALLRREQPQQSVIKQREN